MAANFHAYSLPSTLHQVEILRYYRAYLGMSTYLWKVKVAPGDSEFLSDSKVPCQWSWPFLSTGEHLSNDPSTNITNPSNNVVKAPMHVHSKKSIHTMWLPKGMNLQDTHCSLYCTVSWFAVMPTLTKTSHAAAPRPIPVLLQPLLSRNPGQGQLRF